MSAPSTALGASAAAEGARPASGRWVVALAGLYYLLGAIAVTLWLWRDPASRVVASNPYDTDQFAWFFRYDATAIAHFRLPALTTAGMNAPQGISVMWNTFMLLPGVLLAPVTLLAGPQASLTVLMTIGFAGSATAMFAVLRRWGAGSTAAAFGGLVYGFSPALVHSAIGHYDLQFAVLPPLIVDAALRLATGRCGTGRAASLRGGAYLGLLATAQLLTAEELLFDAALAAVVMMAVLAACRPRAVAGRVREVAAGLATGIGVTAVIAGYPLWVQFFGPIRQHGSPFPPDYFKNDLAGFVRPSGFMLFHTRASAAFAANFQGQLPEYLAYLGWPLLAVLAATAAVFWRVIAVRVTAAAFVLLAAFSLGGTLLAGGHEHEAITLPWYLLQTVSLAGSVIPDRFSIVSDGAAAALLAFGIDAARRRWPAPRWSGAMVTCTAVLAVLPLVPRPLPAAMASAPPAGWPAAFAALRLPPGASVLVVPVPTSTFTEPLRWQADTGSPSSMVGGYFMGPAWDGQAYIDGNGLPAEAMYLNRLWVRSSRGGSTAGDPPYGEVPATAQMWGQITRWHPAAVVAVTGRDSVLGRYLTGLLGRPAVTAGGVLGWHLYWESPGTP
ncbi:MAG: hypothetical protein JOY82_21685 [Streptosporangiaceae bacterium]|nr:hypothetical protein [Streptosporangiaceae bacterium]MBV9857095.1 hypothetical protein [Streptosporangiaceae bacterium]